MGRGEDPPSSEPLANYQRQDKLASGTYGEVYKAIDLSTDEVVAIKTERFDRDAPGVSPATLREIAILRSLNHPNVIRLRDTLVTDVHCSLVFDYVPYDLRKLLARHNGRPIDPRLCCSYAYQLLCGIYYLHVHRVMHRDMKPDNLLVDTEGFLKLCDFGLARLFSVPMRNYTPGVVTQLYRALELFLHNDFYELGIDVWSAGCVIAEMTRGRPLFSADSDRSLAHKVFQSLGTPPDDVINEFADVAAQKVSFPSYPRGDMKQLFCTEDAQLIDHLGKILTIDPRQRITAKQALNHTYFNDVSRTIRDLCYPTEDGRS
jgi:serine/threonine protein kinase